MITSSDNNDVFYVKCEFCPNFIVFYDGVPQLRFLTFWGILEWSVDEETLGPSLVKAVDRYFEARGFWYKVDYDQHPLCDENDQPIPGWTIAEQINDKQPK